MSKEGLLPEDLESSRLSTNFVKVPVSGYPEGYLSPVLPDEGKLSGFSENTLPNSDLIAKLSGEGSLALYRKKSPHGLYGVMMVSTETQGEHSMFCFRPGITENILVKASLFGQLCESNSLPAVVSYTYDPYTTDIRSGQSQKWFHLHLNTIALPQANMITDKRKPLSQLSGDFSRRLIVDEGGVVTSMMLRDKLVDCGVDSRILRVPFENNGPPNLDIVLKGDWQLIKTIEFRELLGLVHTQIIETSTMMQGVFCGEGISNGEWHRPILNKEKIDMGIKEFGWMEEKTRDTLGYFLHHLRPELLERRYVDRLKKRDSSPKASALYPLCLPNYATVISADGGEMHVSIRPQVFSNTGSAGLLYFDKTVVKLVRGTTTYTAEELKLKQDFEKQLKDKLF